MEATPHTITAGDYYAGERRYQGAEAGPGEKSLYVYYLAECRAEGRKASKAGWEAWLDTLPIAGIQPIVDYVNTCFRQVGEEEADGEDPTSGS